jgi:hypothetical protein
MLRRSDVFLGYSGRSSVMDSFLGPGLTDSLQISLGGQSDVVDKIVRSALVQYIRGLIFVNLEFSLF